MNRKFWQEWSGLSTTAIALSIAALSHPALALEETLSLCETDSAAVRVYVEEDELRMRVFDRQDSVVWMNKTPASEDIATEGLQYTNLRGEQTVVLTVNPTVGDCSIQVGDRSAENGALLIQNPRPEAEMATVTGTVSYLQRVALPPGSVVEVKLADVSLADAPAVVVSEQTIVTQGEQVPIPFSLAYAPDEIEPRNRYVVQARITIDDELAWISTTSYPVITQGNPTTVDVLMEPVGDRSSTDSGTDTPVSIIEPGWTTWQPISEFEAAEVSTGFSNMELGGYLDFQNACAQATGQPMDDFPNWFRIDNRVNQIGTGTVEYGCWWDGAMVATFPTSALKNDSSDPYCLQAIASESVGIYSEPAPNAARVGTLEPGDTVKPSSAPALLSDVDGTTWVAIALPTEGWVRHGAAEEAGNFELCQEPDLNRDLR